MPVNRKVPKLGPRLSIVDANRSALRGSTARMVPVLLAASFSHRAALHWIPKATCMRARSA